ncbi:MAG: disulfide oxidoreductase [Candidatus Levybacteria bacterium]|nr:disulfide oxidoreductase [Candidatus Levybacteria bacterium]
MVNKKKLLIFAWFCALGGMLMSLYFSDIMKLVPCVLCWYQRVMLYPLVVIIPIGILKNDKNIPFYVLPFSVIGMIIALYHNLLYYGVIPEAIAPCTFGVSCTTKLIELFGFVTIPMMSLIAFSVITISMSAYIRMRK